MRLINWLWIGIAAMILIGGFIIAINAETVFQQIEGFIILSTSLILAALATLMRSRTPLLDKETKGMVDQVTSMFVDKKK